MTESDIAELPEITHAYSAKPGKWCRLTYPNGQPGILLKLSNGGSVHLIRDETGWKSPGDRSGKSLYLAVKNAYISLGSQLKNAQVELETLKKEHTYK